MTLSNGFPGHTELATFADVRRDLEGAVVRNAAGVMRAGVFPAHLNPLVTGRSDMRVQIGDFRAVQNRGGAIFLSNAGVDTSVTLDAAPAANKRIDLIYVTQLSTTLGDSSSGTVFGVVKGTASATPVVPSLPAGLADALPLATVEIPAGATTTLSSGVVISQVYRYTATAGGTVVVRNTVELAAWTPADGAKAYCLSDASEYVRQGGVWRKSGSGLIASGTITAQSSITIDGLTGYSAYEIVLDLPTSSTTSAIGAVLRAGGVSNSTANYDYQRLSGADAAAAAASSVGQTSWAAISVTDRVDKFITLKLYGLNQVRRTVGELRAQAFNATSQLVHNSGSLRHRAATAFDGVGFAVSSGTVSGWYEVRGV